MKPEQGDTFLKHESLGILAILALASALASVSIELDSYNKIMNIHYAETRSLAAELFIYS